MPSESTPLLQNVPVAEPRPRYPHQTVCWQSTLRAEVWRHADKAQIRRYCTIALTVVPFTILVVGLLYYVITGGDDIFGERDAQSGRGSVHRTYSATPHKGWPESEGLTYAELKQILSETPDPDKAREWSEYYTAGPHLCGKNLSQAEWTRDLWASFGIRTEIAEYELYLNYPASHRLALLEDGEVTFEATLTEDVLPEDPTTGLEDSVPTFHGYSASGDVTAPIVFCNYGTYYDFKDLVEAGVDLEGKIALIKYGLIFRGLKVKRASELGMIGAILYSDPGDDGEVTEENGYEKYPNGPARNPSSVQRGSVQFLSIAPGDPTTPGYPSKPGVPRQSVEGKIPDIPSLPISYAEALPFLKALNGHGPNVSSFNSWWQSGGLAYKGVNYNIGPTPSNITVRLMNEQEYVTTPAWNAIGVINGTIVNEVIVMGNHRDAWIAGGAGDPNSGSAAMNEVIRAFGTALQKGWKPQRTIVFASWDGEEYGLLGSTEWVEEFIPWLSASTVAYLNIDIGTSGSQFATSAAPVLNNALIEVLGQVQSPNQTVAGQTVRDTWDGHISTMGSGSDFTAFQDFVGISSVDIGFKPGPKDPIYHYHSNYDSFWWMDNYGDQGFQYHVAIAKILALLAAKLLEEPVVAFNATDYALGLKKYLQQVKDHAAGQDLSELEKDWNVKKKFKVLDKAILAFQHASQRFDKYAATLTALLTQTSSELSSFDNTNTSMGGPSIEELHTAVRTVNGKYKLLERQFLYDKGLDSRSWFKHVVFAPGLWTGYAGATFPGLIEALDAENASAVEKWVGIVEEALKKATDLLTIE